MNAEEVFAVVRKAVDDMVVALGKVWSVFEEFMKSKGRKVMRRYKKIKKQRVRANHRLVTLLNE